MPVTGPSYVGQVTLNSSASLRAVNYGSDGNFVAVGLSGVLWTSENAIVWTARTSGVTDHLLGVAYNGTHWVAVGQNGRIITATDPTGTWTSRTSNTTNQLYNVAWDGTYWATCGLSGTIRYQTDPTAAWSTATSNTAQNLYSIAYGNGYWGVCGDGHVIQYRATDPAGAWSSADAAGTITDSLSAINYNGTVWAAVTQTGTFKSRYRSTDPAGTFSVGTTTTSAMNPGLTVNGSTFVAAGDSGKIYTSTDGNNWTSRTSGVAVSLFGAGCFAKNLYVIVGYSGTILTSPDAVTWTQRPGGQLRINPRPTTKMQAINRAATF